MKYTVGQCIKDWRGRDFTIRRIIPAPSGCAQMMTARGWEPFELVIEYAERVRMGYVRISDGTVHEAVRVDDAYPEGVNHAAQY